MQGDRNGEGDEERQASVGWEGRVMSWHGEKDTVASGSGIVVAAPVVPQHCIGEVSMLISAQG